MGDALDAVTRGLGMAGSRQVGAVFGAWAGVVGEHVAAHSRPVSLRDGVLVVHVDEPAWATQLRYLTGELLERLGDAVGAGVVTRVEVRVRPLSEPRKEPRNW